MPSRQRVHRHLLDTPLRRSGRLLTWAARSLILVSLLLLPLFLGGNHPLATGYILLLGLASCGLWIAGSALRRRLKLSVPQGLFLLVPAVLILFLQLVPILFPLFSTSALSDLWQKTSDIVAIDPVLAVIPNQQADFIIRILILALFYCLISELFRGVDRAFQLVLAVLAAATLSAFLGLAEHFGHIDWFTYVDGYRTSVARGGYLNRNHFAQLCAMGYFCGIGVFVALLSAKTGSSLAHRIPSKKKTIMATAVGMATICCGLAVVFSYSRSAILTSGFGTVILTILLATTRTKRFLSIPVLAAVFALSVGALYGLDLVVSRVELALSGNDPSGLARIEIWNLVWSAIQMSPILGSGAAAVSGLTPLFDTSFMPGKIAFDAHNDYLELMAVFGIPFALTVIACILLTGFRMGKRLWLHRHSDSSFLPIALALFVGLAGALVHECSDYGFKHIANLVVFATLCVALSELLEHIHPQRTDSDEHGLPYKRIPLSKTQAILTSGITCLVLLSCIPYALSRIRLGDTLLHVQNLVTAPAIRSNMKTDDRLNRIRKASSDALAIDSSSRETAFTRLQASLDLARERESILVAGVLSQRFDRPISPERARGRTYRPYWIESIRAIPENQRQAVIDILQDVQKDALALARQTPSNAIELSIAAMARDHIAAFSSAPMTSQDLHRKALELYPWHVDILKRALRAATVSNTRQNLSDDDLAIYAKRLCKQAPQELSWVLPILWSTKDSPELLASVTPETIAAQERLARFLLEHHQTKEALEALNRMEALNRSRPDEETPDSMGILPYLSRETRNKNTVARDIERLRVHAFTTADQPVNRVASEEKLAKLEEGLRHPVYEQIDQWMANGQWILAQKSMVRLPKNADRLIREAEIAYAMGAFRQAKRLLEQLAWLQDEPNQRMKQRAKRLAERLPSEPGESKEAAPGPVAPTKGTTP